MGIELREALRRLCVEFGWSYAVFWRAIGSRDPTHLIWEDGHWERMPGISGHEAVDLLFENNGAVQNSPSDCSTELQRQVIDRMDMLVNKMMATQVHVVGDGIIGQAASTGNHHWIFSNTLNDYRFLVKGLTEMNHQFLEGIQTIAIIPVLAHCVVQLGSTQMIMENISFVNHVRNLFAQLGCLTGAPLSDITQKTLFRKSQLNDGIPSIASVVMPAKQTITSKGGTLSDSVQPMSKPKGLSSSSLTYIEGKILSMSSIKPREFANNAEPALDNTEALQQRSHECAFPNSLKDSGTVSLSGRSESLNDASGLGIFRSLTDGTMKTVITPYANLSRTDIPQTSKKRNTAKSIQGVSGISSLSHLPSNGSHDMKDNSDPEVPYVSNEKSSLCHRQTTSGNDLFDVLGPDFKTDRFCGILDDVFVHRDYANSLKVVTDVSTCTAQLDTSPDLGSLNNEISDTGIFSVADADQLLDAIVSKVNSGVKQNSDDTPSRKASLTKICSSSFCAGSNFYDYSASSEEIQGEPFGLSPVLLKQGTAGSDSGSVKSTCTSHNSKSFGLSPLHLKQEAAGSRSVKSICTLDNRAEGYSHSVRDYKSQISLWVESGQSMKCDNFSAAQSKKVSEIGNLKRKRPRPGESPRPRPKDRQMIMDRVKELREIVPNGAKCSIDALLEKTIKHMLFLQSVTKHADKLKDIGESKIISKEGGLLLKDDFEGGATWAFEIGTQPITCPIIVEDLIPPRQMLVEMLCEQRGLFLEIADIIRGLGLTILKGMMESRKDRVWARFAVEANRDVTRMEIFLSPVRLLKPMIGTRKTLQCLYNSNVPHDMLHQSCIPATGASNCLR